MQYGTHRITPAAAETLALQALGHLAQDEDLLMAFLGESGLGLDELRAGAADPAILGGVLDFLLARDETLMAFCEAAGEAPERVHLARYTLPGGRTE